MGQESWGRGPQAPGRQAQQQKAGAGEVGWLPKLSITGCRHDVVGPIIRGDYNMASMNHGKPAYKKETANNGLVANIYFWDERDGPASSGWWIGPQVGGNMVWGHHPNRSSATPPTSGWQAPHSAPPDLTMVVSPKGEQSAVAAGKGQAKAQWAQQAAWGGSAQQGGGAQAQMREKFEAQRKEQEEANRQKLAVAQQKIEVQKKQQLELQQKRLAEQAKTNATIKASSAIRAVIGKVRAATPETFDKLKEELAAVLAKEFEGCGPHKEKVQEEADKSLEQAASKVETILEQRKQQEQKMKEMEEKRKEAEEKAQELLKEMSEILEEAEEAAKEFQEAVEGFVEESGKTTDEVNKAASSVDTTDKSAQESTQKCTDFTKTNGNAMKVPVAVKKDATEEEKKTAAEAPTFNKCSARLMAAKASMDKARREFTISKDKALKKAGANATLKGINTMFSKYDKDKDGKLNKKEIEAFAKGEHKFTMPAEATEALLVALGADGAAAAGVKLADFQRLKAAVGVARERSKDQEKRVLREKREKELADQKAKVQVTIDAVADTVKAAEEKTQAASKEQLTLLSQGKTMKSPAMLARATEYDELLDGVRASLVEVQKGIEGLGSGIEIDEALALWLKNERTKLEVRLKNLRNVVAKAETVLKKFRDEAAVKDVAELKELAKKAVTLLKVHQAAKEMQSLEIFKAIAKGKVSIQADAFVAFLKKAQAEAQKAKEAAKKDDDAEEKKETAEEELLSDEEFKRAFTALDDEEEGFLSEENFVRLLRQVMKVMKDIVITSEICIKESKTLRRLEVGEAVEVLEGPKLAAAGGEEAMKRVRARAMKDDVEGWVTVEGNQGTIFLKEGGDTYKVVKETILTESFKIGAPKEEARKIKESTRKLKVGELVTVREWEKKDEETGLTRMKCKVKQDGLVGYLTTIGNTGIRFVEPL